MKIDAETLKKQVILHLPYVLFLLVFAKLGEAVRLAPGADASQKLLGLSEGFALAFQSMWPGAAMDWLIGFCGAAIMRLAVYLRGKDAKKYRKNVEYGSARWGNKADIAPFMDPKPENNIILTQSEGLMLNGRPKNPANARNKNVLVVGGSGSGKTRFFIKPNLMQMHSSYVVTDPKGTVLVECGKMLQRGTPKLDKDGKPVRNEKGKIIYESYKIRVFNTINFQKSMHFNPFAYIHSEKDILKIVTTLIANTKGEGKAGDDFWVKAETLLYTALIGYIYYEAPANEQNFATLVEMLNAMEVREDDESFKNAVDLLFDALEQKDPDHFALRQYKKYKLAAGLTIPDFDLEIIGSHLYTVDEMKIINQIAGVYSDMGQNKKAADIYYQLLKYVQKHQQEAVISSGMLPMVLGNYARALDLCGYYKDAVDYAQRGIEACVRYGHYQMLYACLAIQAESYHFMKQDEKSAEAYHEAYYLCKVIGRKESMLAIQEEAKNYIGLEFRFK